MAHYDNDISPWDMHPGPTLLLPPRTKCAHPARKSSQHRGFRRPYSSWVTPLSVNCAQRDICGSVENGLKPTPFEMHSISLMTRLNWSHFPYDYDYNDYNDALSMTP
jgi:hypothetical protein